MSQVLIGIGSNIDAESNLQKAAAFLRENWPAIRFSRVYKTAPRDKPDQPDFLNAVGLFESNMEPEAIHEILQLIERQLGKNITERSGPRTIDLDILLYGDEVIDTPDLTIPHPRMHERRFVLEPLLELIPGTQRHPLLGRTWDALKQGLMNQTCEKTLIQL